MPGYKISRGEVLPELPLGHTYDWKNMPLEYPYVGYSQVEANAVAVLMRDCGWMIFSDYGPVGSSGTGASTYHIPAGLTTYMGYDKRVRTISRNGYTTSEWNSLMQGELESTGRLSIRDLMIMPDMLSYWMATPIRTTTVSTGVGAAIATDIFF